LQNYQKQAELLAEIAKKEKPAHNYDKMSYQKHL
jgi:hypothetical protein